MGHKKNRGKAKQHPGSPSHTTPPTSPPVEPTATSSTPISNPENKPRQPMKDTKTQDERRKEIEARVLAARIIQMKSESSYPQQDDPDSTLKLSSGTQQRQSNGGKHVEIEKTTISALKIGPVREYWKTRSIEEKRSFLQLSVQELQDYFAGTGSISEGLSFSQKTKSWKCWSCCHCAEKFTEREKLFEHIWTHIDKKIILPENHPATPKEVDGLWEDMLLNGSWEPVDLNAAMKDPQDCDSHQQHLKTDDSYGAGSIDMQEVQEMDKELEVGDVRIQGIMESGDNIGIPSSGLRGDGSKQRVEAYPISKRWPSCDDPERAKLLEKIHDMFQLLLKHNCLSDSHIRTVISYTMEELKQLFLGFRLLECGLNKTPVCICFLGASQIRNVLSFLQELSNACKLSEDSEKNTLEEDNWDVDTPVTNVLGGISFSDDSSHLILDEFLLTAETESAGMDDGATASVLCDDGGPDRDGFLSWLFSSSTADVTSWVRLMSEKIDQGKKIFQKLADELNLFGKLCAEKSKHVGYLDGLSSISQLCDETLVEDVPQDFVTALRKRQEELVERKDNPEFMNYKFQHTAISNVLEEAESFNVTQSGQPVATSCFLGLESNQEYAWEKQFSLNESDRIVAIGMRRQRKKFFMEVSRLDARIRQSFAAIQQLKRKLGATSAFDNQEGVVFLVKAFLMEHLEDLAKKFAKEKSDAARESLLEELALEAKKNTNKGESSKHTQGKLKKKKKKKDSRTAKKDQKGLGLDKDIISDQETSEKLILHCATDIDVNQREIENVVTESRPNLKQLEEEFVRKTQLEEEEELEEALEYQRQIENEVKQKHLAEKYGKECEMLVENVTEGSLVDGKSNTGYQDPLEEQWQQTKKVSIQSDSSLVSLKGMEIVGSHYPQASILTIEQNNELTFGSFTPDELLKLRLEKVQFKSQEPDPDVNLSVVYGLPKDSKGTHTKSIEKNVVPGSSSRSLPEHDEERFKAEIGKAIKQSLGLNNDDNDNTCFLKVIVQSLWRIRRFREEFLRTSESRSPHKQVGNPCVVCQLYQIFRALSHATTEIQRNTVDYSDLRTGLSKLCANRDSFEVMNNASDVLNAIFSCLHQSFTSSSDLHDSVSKESENSSWDCIREDCLAHNLFGMRIIEKITCNNCGLSSSYRKYTSFVHYINANELQTMKISSSDTSLDELLKHVVMDNEQTCDPEKAGCGSRNYIHHILASAPHVFIAVLASQSTSISADDRSSTLAAISSKLDIGIISRTLSPQNRYCLTSMVCCHGQHYRCFAYSLELDLWATCGDTTVKAIGSWNNLISMINRGNFQPLVLVFESVIAPAEKKPSLLSS